MKGTPDFERGNRLATRLTMADARENGTKPGSPPAREPRAAQVAIACGNPPNGKQKGAAMNSTSAQVQGPGADTRSFAEGPNPETKRAHRR